MPYEAPEAILYKEECYEIQGAIFEVYREMGCGFLESVYQECLELELSQRNIPFERQVEVGVTYRGVALRPYFVADVICYGKIIVELKACKALEPIHRAQVLNYLKATGHAPWPAGQLQSLPQSRHRADNLVSTSAPR